MNFKIALIALILAGVIFTVFQLDGLTSSFTSEKTIEGKVVEKVEVNESETITSQLNANAVTSAPILQRKVTVPLLAVDGSNKGRVVNIDITRVRGTGKVLADVSQATLASGTQESLVKAANAAGDLSPQIRNARLNSDLIFSFNAEGVREVSGGSAGTAIATGVALILSDVGYSKSVLITGSLGENGAVKPVGGVYEKVKAAKKMNFTLVVVPNGQKVQAIDFVNETQICRPTITGGGQECTIQRRLENRSVDLSKEFSINVVEVSNVAQAYTVVARQ